MCFLSLFGLVHLPKMAYAELLNVDCGQTHLYVFII